MPSTTSPPLQSPPVQPSPGRATFAAIAPAAEPPSSRQCLDAMADLIDLHQALAHAADQPDILLRVIRKFVQHYGGAGAALLALVEKGDLQGAARSLHKLRGVIGLIGVDRLREMTIDLEAALVQGRAPHTVHAQAVSLANALDALVADLARRLPPG